MATRPAVVGWRFDGKSFELKRSKTVQGVDVWATVLPFLPVPLSIYRDEHGEVRGFRVRFVFGDRQSEVELPSHIVRDRDPAKVIADAGGPDITGVHAKFVVQLLGDVIAGKGRHIDDVPVITEARWDGDRLRVPGPERVLPSRTQLARYGHKAVCTEEQALEAWRTVVEIAQLKGNHRFALTTGMPFGSLYVEPRALSTFVLHVRGDSTLGKTEGTEIAMNTVSSARKPNGALYRTWDLSAQAPIALALSVGIMPLYLDETATSTLDPDELRRVVFVLAQGKRRGQSTVDLKLADDTDQTWFASVLSTGEMSVLGTSDLTGTRRRVLEISAPLIMGAALPGIRPEDVHHQALKASRDAYGWPLYWLAEDPDVDAFAKAHEDIGNHLSRVVTNAEAASRLAFVELDNIATALSGFVVLGRLVGMDVLEDAKLHGVALFEELRDRFAQEGTTLAERVVNAIKTAMLKSPERFPLATADNIAWHERVGVRFTDEPDVVGIIDKRFFQDLGFNPDVTLSELKSADLLITEKGRGYRARRRVWKHEQTEALVPLYVVTIASVDDVDAMST